MLAIFDNDGTLCDTQAVEGRCYALAIQRVTGRLLSSTDWSAYEEPTSASIVRGLLTGDVDAEEKENLIKAEFCQLLREEQPKHPGDFSLIAGATNFLRRLTAIGIQVAIATGGFDGEASFKLQCCGIALSDYPHATSSDVPRRSDIIALAAARAGQGLSAAVYFGDAPWDVRACANLSIPMIGIGRRHVGLRSLGLTHSFRDFSEPEKVIDAFHQAVLRPAAE